MNKFKRLIFVVAFMLFMPNVLAGSFSVSSSDLTPNVGDTVTITVKTNDAAGYFSVSSSNSNVLSGGGSTDFLDNASASFKFTVKSAGSAVITVTPRDCAGYDEKEITGSKSITINASSSNSSSNRGSSNNGGSSNNSGTTVRDNNTVKSSVNYLSSLSIEGAELSPAFDKDTTEYDVVLPNGTTGIHVSGDKESSVSYVTGLGDVAVSEGVNFISVVVTAENGAKRTYNIRATVEEESPIIVNVNDTEMTLIRKSESMPSASDYYTLGNITIGENEIPAYTSEVTGYTLVALKDQSGNVSLYKYDNDVYTLYKEYGFNSLKLSMLDATSIPKGYTEGTINVDGNDVKAYIKEGSMPLLYGMNVETGEINFYSYDSTEGTIQKFEVIEANGKSKYYPLIIIGLVVMCLFEFFIIICVIASKNKKLKKALRSKLDSKTEYEKSFDSKRNSIYKDESNITDDLTDEYMSSSEELGHTAIISNSVNNVFDNSINRKDLKKKSKKNKNIDDDMYKF